MSTSPTLIAFKLKHFNCRTTVKSLIPIKYVKDAIFWEVYEIAKGLEKTSQQTLRHTHLENLVYATDIKRNSIIKAELTSVNWLRHH